jgi:hypothetical protein
MCYGIIHGNQDNMAIHFSNQGPLHRVLMASGNLEKVGKILNFIFKALKR